MNFFNINIADSASQCLESVRKQKSRREHPIITREGLNGTLDIAWMFSNKNVFVRHSALDSVDESGEFKRCFYKTNREKTIRKTRKDDKDG